MSWLKKVFSLQSSQETKVVNEKTKEDKKKRANHKLRI